MRCYAGPGLRELASRFDAWWYDGETGFGPAWFWGDLDFAGMQILKSLRSRFENLEAWPVGYEPPRAQLEVGGGHGTRANDSKGQIDPILTGCAYADSELLPRDPQTWPQGSGVAALGGGCPNCCNQRLMAGRTPGWSCIADGNVVT